jgi:hypothetical protein
MTQTDRQKANDLLEEFALLGIEAEDVLNHVIGNFLSGSDALEALESFKEENLPGYEGIPTQDEDGDLIPMDKNGDEIYVGASVNVDSPGPNDSWNFDFEGTVIELNLEDAFAIVEDQDGDCFSVEFEKLELA